MIKIVYFNRITKLYHRYENAGVSFTMSTLINPNSSIPMYKQAIQFINDLIARKKLQPGDKIPSETELVSTLGVSRITIRSAITEMVEEGLLTRSQGKGTFVALPQKDSFDANDSIGFTESCRMAGKKASSEVLSIEKVYAPSKYLKFLNISEDTKIVRSTRLRFVDNEPKQLEINYYSPRLNFLINENLESSLFELLKNKYNIQVCNFSRVLKFRYATPEESSLLNIKKNSPLFIFEDMQTDEFQTPLYVSRQLYDPENVEFHFNSSNHISKIMFLEK